MRCRVYAYGNRGYLSELLVLCISEEVGKRNLNGRGFATVPVYAQNKVAVILCHNGAPNMLNGAHKINIGNSSNTFGCEESSCWWKYCDLGICEWTYEGGRKRLLVVTDGAPYPLSVRIAY